MFNIVIALFLLAHAAIHASFVSPRPPVTAGGPQWPFELRHSWLLTPFGASAGFTYVLGLALILVTIAGYALAALAALGIGPSGLWLPAVVIGSVGSLGLLGLFFHPWLVVGVVIDLALIWAVRIARWEPA